MAKDKSSLGRNRSGMVMTHAAAGANKGKDSMKKGGKATVKTMGPVRSMKESC
mgnify:CR=1 FL=1